jgi:hypothetical protein
MQAITLHRAKRPLLSKGTSFLPILSWQVSKAPVRVLRAADALQYQHKAPYVTLVDIPETHPVSLIVGSPSYTAGELSFTPLANLPAEDREILTEWLRHPSDVAPDLSSNSASYLVQLIIGASLPARTIKWTRDFRLVEQGHRNSSTKRVRRRGF